ncbi:MAG TPA: hypothetical protein VFI39_00175 [Gemmatimonadales bacterium]|nr:hypothetical protein [Gemmatimonadales bacterium]
MSMQTWKFVLVGTVLLAGCSADPTSPLAIGSVQVVSGDGQSGTPGLPLNDTLTVKVLDQTGRSPMSGVPVQWSVQYGGGSLDRSVDTTDLQGIVRAVWTLGGTPGANRAVAAVADLPGVEFSAQGQGFRALQVSVGNDHACAIDTLGRGWCWGDDTYGELGNGIPLDSSPMGYQPQRVAGGHTFVQVASGWNHVCALDGAGRTWCWGDNGFGQLGGSSLRNSSTPLQIAGAPAFRALAQGGNSSTTCGIATDNTAYCWGENDHGEAGTGSVAAAVTSPHPVAGAHQFRSITLGSAHTCGIAVDGTAWCWGLNNQGQLGDSMIGGSSTVPVQVAGAFQFSSLVAGFNYTCGQAIGAGWVCWGPVFHASSNSDSVWASPTRTPALDQFSEFVPGDFMGGAVEGGRGIMTFGVDEANDAGASLPLHTVSASDVDACALAADGTVYCWGWNDGGQLGNPYHFGWEPAYLTAQVVVGPPPGS